MVQEFKNAVTNLEARGGRDCPENLGWALEQAINTPWSGNAKILVVITDGPAHGKEYHAATMEDNEEKVEKDYLKKVGTRIAKEGMQLVFCQLRKNLTKETEAALKAGFEAADSNAETPKHDMGVVPFFPRYSDGVSTHFVFFLDVSSSMNPWFSKNKWKEVVAALFKFMESRKTNQGCFSDLYSIFCYNTATVAKCVAASWGEVMKLRDDLEKQEMSGDTTFAQAIRWLFEGNNSPLSKTKEGTDTVVIFLTDGEDNDATEGEDSPARVAVKKAMKEYKNKERRLNFNTVGILGYFEKGKEMLDNMAKDGNGQFVNYDGTQESLFKAFEVVQECSLSKEVRDQCIQELKKCVQDKIIFDCL